jgi:hypothetical protein
MWITKRIQGARQSIFFWLLLAIFTLSGCGTSSSPEATTMPPIELPTQAVATAVPTETAELTAAATPTTDVAPPPAPSDDPYLDDRSDPITLLHSLVNALNQHEYLRAYGYWEENAPNLPVYDTFAQGYAETESVQLQTGAVYVGAAAGNTYFEIPTILTAQTTGG